VPDVRARYPELIRLPPDRPPVIVGQVCGACGRRSFPPDPYGCEACGATADQLAPTELPASGVIHAVATVHRHHHPRPGTPFTVATVVLDDGITLKGVLEGDVTAARVGSRVRGVVVPWDRADDGSEVVDLRFRVVGETEAG
jgi:uncharacterized OB-fold protein